MQDSTQAADLVRRGTRRRSGVARALSLLTLAASLSTAAACGGKDEPTVITTGPIDTSTLTGTWSASSGRSGTFTVTKQ